MQTVSLCETFVSIQGESTYAGLPCFFIRLAGCNLRCTYCDTAYAWTGGKERSVTALVRECAAHRAPLVEITGGEPLLQPGCAALAMALRGIPGKTVLVETNGSRDISVLPPGVIAIMDVKCPGSGQSVAFDMTNLARLRPTDEVKFVLCDRGDYEWAKAFVAEHRLAERCHAVLFSPAHGRLETALLARWLLQDCLPVRLQVQLHRLLGMR
jgi:7-carboxy-7-deazaguanine synthase